MTLYALPSTLPLAQIVSTSIDYNFNTNIELSNKLLEILPKDKVTSLAQQYELLDVDGHGLQSRQWTFFLSNGNGIMDMILIKLRRGNVKANVMRASVQVPTLYQQITTSGHSGRRFGKFGPKNKWTETHNQVRGLTQTEVETITNHLKKSIENHSDFRMLNIVQ